MMQRAAAIAVALVCALIGPAQAQPFSDVPTNHWAYDAIAQLAAKGLVQGYPDGTFKGDRTMTRYEMAMVVARLLARIETIQVPGPQTPVVQTPQITRADVETVQQLVTEFRSELAALGARVTAIEEELNAIKARMDNVRIAGAYRFRYENQRTATGDSGVCTSGFPSGCGVNGNSTTGTTGGSTQLGLARHAAKLIFDGTVTRDVHFIAALLSSGGPTTQFITLNSSGIGAAGPATLASVDNAFFDWKNAFEWPVEIWLGRFGGTSPPGTTYPVQFGPFGLLMSTAGDTWEDSTADSAFNVADGLRIAGRFKGMADLQIQAAIIRVVGQTGASSYFTGEDAYGVDANAQVIEGVRLGGYYVANSITNPAGFPAPGTAGNPAPNGALWHLYGPGGGSMGPATANCPAVATLGIQCAARGNGWGGYVQWDIVPNIHLDGEYAQWNDTVHSISDNGWQVNLTWDLGELTGFGHGLTLLTGYLYFGPNFYPPYGSAEADISMADVLYPGNAKAFTAALSFNPVPSWTVYGTYVTGSNISNNQSLCEYEAGAKWGFANNADITFLVRSLRINNVEQLQLYRAELDYQF